MRRLIVAISGLLIALLPSIGSPAPFGYVPSFDSADTVYTFDVATNTALPSIHVGGGPCGIARNSSGSRVYVATGSQRISVIDTASSAISATIDISMAFADGCGPTGMAVDPAGSFLYLGPGLTVVNLASNEVVQAFNFGGSSLAIDPSGALLYMTEGPEGPDTIAVVDTGTFRVVASINLPEEPRQLAIHPSGAFLYVTYNFAQTMSVVDTRSRSIVATVPIGEPGNIFHGIPGVLAVHPSGAFVYVTRFDPESPGSLAVIDTAKNSVITTVSVDHPTALAVHPAGTILYAFVDGINVSAISTATNTVTATFRIEQCGTICAGISALGMVIAGDQVKPGPSLSLTPDKSSYVTNDMFQLNFTVANPGLATNVDVYFGALLPAGAGPALGCPGGDAVIFLADAFMRSVTTCLSASPPTFAPLVRTASLAAGIPETVIPNFFGFRWPAGSPAGVYTFFIAFTGPSTLDVIASAVTSVNFAP